MPACRTTCGDCNCGKRAQHQSCSFRNGMKFKVRLKECQQKLASSFATGQRPFVVNRVSKNSLDCVNQTATLTNNKSDVNSFPSHSIFVKNDLGSNVTGTFDRSSTVNCSSADQFLANSDQLSSTNCSCHQATGSLLLIVLSGLVVFCKSS